MLFAYIYMTTVKTTLPMPLLLLPLSLCISMYESPFSSAVTGLAAGLLLDNALGTIIGFNGILLLWCCLFTSLLFIFVMRRHVVNILLLTLATSLIQGFLHYLFYYSIWGYSTGADIFVGVFLSVIAISQLFTIIFYYIVRFLFAKIGIINENYYEEKSDNIVRE